MAVVAVIQPLAAAAGNKRAEVSYGSASAGGGEQRAAASPKAVPHFLPLAPGFPPVPGAASSRRRLFLQVQGGVAGQHSSALEPHGGRLPPRPPPAAWPHRRRLPLSAVPIRRASVPILCQGLRRPHPRPGRRDSSSKLHLPPPPAAGTPVRPDL